MAKKVQGESQESRQADIDHQKRLRLIALVSAISVASVGLIGAVVKELVPEVVPDFMKHEQWCVRVTPRIDDKHTHCKDTRAECEELREFLLGRQKTSIGGVVTVCRRIVP